MVMFPFSTTCLAVSGVVSWVQYDRIRLDEAAQRGVVVPRIVVVQAQARLLTLPGEATIGRRVTVAGFAAGRVAQFVYFHAARVRRQGRAA